MNRQRILTILLVLTPVLLAGAVLRQFRVPLVGPVAAQGHAQSGPFEPGRQRMRMARPEERKAAVVAVQGQLNAFQKDDFAKAVQFQSSNLKHSFRSVAQFRQMMRNAYPAFINFKSVHFLDGRADATGRHVFMPIVLVGPDGTSVRALYFLVREGTVYRVDGVAGGDRAPLSARPGGVDA